MRIKLKYVIFALVCMCMVPWITHAECDYQRRAELSRMASNVQVNYVYDGTSFQVIITNLTSDLYTTDMYGRIIRGEEVTLEYPSGSFRFHIFANDTSCFSGSIITKTVTLPTLNSFSYYEECRQNPGFKYCQLWGNYSLSTEQFEEEINNYKNTQDTLAQADDSDSVLSIILDTLMKNMYMFIFLAIVVLLTLIYRFFNKKRR